jgi:hypothetical protein
VSDVVYSADNSTPFERGGAIGREDSGCRRSAGGQLRTRKEGILKRQLARLSWTVLLAALCQNPAVAQQDLTTPAEKPVINYFNVAPAGILPNQTAILTMSVSGATSIKVTFSPCTPPDCTVGDGQAIETVLLNPAVTTVYTVKASNASGSVMASQRVEVGEYDNSPPPVPKGLKVTWGGACWYDYDGEQDQAMLITAKIPNPPGGLPIEATLYYGSTTCDPAGGVDNLNDLQTLIYSGSYYFFFINHPNITGSSAIWTLGNQSSGCVSYEEAPACN